MNQWEADERADARTEYTNREVLLRSSFMTSCTCDSSICLTYYATGSMLYLTSFVALLIRGYECIVRER